MPALDTSVVEAMAKEGFTPDQMEKQFFEGHELLSRLEKRKPIEVSERGAVTTVQTGSGGGVTMVPPTGSRSLNQAGGPKVGKATWKLGRIRNAVEFDTAILTQVSGEPKSVASAVDLAVSDNLSQMQQQLTRQIGMDGSGIVCQLKANTTTNTLKLETSGAYGLGREVMRNGWLPLDQQIEIGTTTEPSVISASATITSFSGNEEEPTITVNGSALSTTTSHYVSLRGSRSGSSSYEIPGFRNFSDQSSVLGEINPSTTPGWKGGFKDTSGGPITIGRVKTGLRKARVHGNGVIPDYAWTSPEQLQYLEEETFQMIRFASPGDQNIGDGTIANLGPLKIEALMECPIGDFTFSSSKYLFALRNEAPYWVADKTGGKMFTTQPGTTFLFGDQEFFMSIYTTRRNTVSQLINLEATS
jgi:hypothetical protein